MSFDVSPASSPRTPNISSRAHRGARVGPNHQAKIPQFGEASNRPESQLLDPSQELDPRNSTRHPLVSILGERLFYPLGPYLLPESDCSGINPQITDVLDSKPNGGWIGGLAPGEQKRFVSASGESRLIYHSDENGGLLCFKICRLTAKKERILCDDWLNSNKNLPFHLRYCKHIVEMQGRYSKHGNVDTHTKPLSRSRTARACNELDAWQRRGICLLQNGGMARTEFPSASDTEGSWGSSDTDCEDPI